MIAAFHTAASGMAAASARASTVAANIVNVLSAGTLASDVLSAQRAYRPQSALTTSSVHGGVRTATLPRTPATVLLYDPDHPSADKNGMTAYPNVSPEQEAIEMMLAAHAYKANARILKTADEMLGALIDRRL